jgi:nucleotide-binding universal stress UspA family protein
MKDRLIVGFDSSESSVSAVRWAAREADIRHASMRIISSYVLPSVMDIYGYGMAAATAAEKRKLADDCDAKIAVVVKEALRLHPSIGIDYKAVDEDAVAALVREAADADLLIVGSSGSGAVASFLLGSVAAGALHHSPCPVVIVPTKVADTIGRVVVGCDGSEPSDRAVRWAAEEAQRRDAELIVVHAWTYPYRLTAEGLDRGSDIVQVDAALVLEQAVRIAREQTTGAVEGLLVNKSPAQALLDESERTDLLVVGSRGRGGFRSMVLGSVAMAVTAHAVAPVGVVR